MKLGQLTSIKKSHDVLKINCVQNLIGCTFVFILYNLEYDYLSYLQKKEKKPVMDFFFCHNISEYA